MLFFTDLFVCIFAEAYLTLNMSISSSYIVNVSPCLQLKDLHDKYSECEDMLSEAREDIKNLRNKSLPNSTVQRYTALASVLPMDSLAAEIEGTFRKGLDTPPSSEYKWVCDFFFCVYMRSLIYFLHNDSSHLAVIQLKQGPSRVSFTLKICLL